jgi:hypothetical protein
MDLKRRTIAYAFAAVGVGFLIYGIGQIYEPAALIFAGLVWVVLGLLVINVDDA